MGVLIGFASWNRVCASILDMSSWMMAPSLAQCCPSIYGPIWVYGNGTSNGTIDHIWLLWKFPYTEVKYLLRWIWN